MDDLFYISILSNGQVSSILPSGTIHFKERRRIKGLRDIITTTDQWLHMRNSLKKGMCTFFVVLIKDRGSHLGVILPVGDTRSCLKTFVIVITGGEGLERLLLTDGGERPGGC